MSTLRLFEQNQGDVAREPDGHDIATLSERSPHGPPNHMERHTSPLLKGLAIDYDPDVFTVTHKGAHVAHVGIEI